MVRRFRVWRSIDISWKNVTRKDSIKNISEKIKGCVRARAATRTTYFPSRKFNYYKIACASPVTAVADGRARIISQSHARFSFMNVAERWEFGGTIYTLSVTLSRGVVYSSAASATDESLSRSRGFRFDNEPTENFFLSTCRCYCDRPR